MSNHPPEAERGVRRSLYLPEVGTVEDIAEHLRMSPETVRRKLRDGTLVGRKVGRRWYITRRALLGIVEGEWPRGDPVAARKIWSVLAGDNAHATTHDPEGGP